MNRLRVAAKIHRIIPKPIDVGGLIRTEHGEHFVADRVPISFQPANRAGHRDEIVKDEQVRDEMVVLHEFALFISHVFRDDAVAAERYPLDKAIEPLTLGGRRLVV